MTQEGTGTKRLDGRGCARRESGQALEGDMKMQYRVTLKNAPEEMEKEIRKFIRRINWERTKAGEEKIEWEIEKSRRVVSAGFEKD